MKPREFIRLIEIIAPHLDKGWETGYFMGAEHDIIYFYVDETKIPQDSDEGKELVELGAHISSDVNSWAVFV